MSILNVIKEIRGANKRPDNQAILDRMNKTSATNVNRNHIDKQMNDDIDNNTTDGQIETQTIHRNFPKKNDDNDKKSTDQFSREPSINEDINTPTGLQTKRSNCNMMLEHNITTLKTGSITMKNFMMQEIFNISQKIEKIEQTDFRNEAKHSRDENNSKMK